MTVPPESIEVGKCYLMETGHLRRVLRIFPDERVQYEHSTGSGGRGSGWKPGMQSRRTFADLIEREIPWDWTPESDR